jgi:uncharacterized protein involved in outer membrane biogenesis
MAEAGGKKGGILKKFLVVAGIFVVLVAGVAIAVPLMVDWEKVRKMAEELGSKATGRQVVIEKLSVSVFSGVDIRGFRIGAGKDRGFKAEPLVQADRVTARYSLWRLFLLQVSINKVELVKPKIFIERNRKGVFSFNDLLKKTAKAGGDNGNAQSKPLQLPVELNVKTVSISEGIIQFRDASRKPVLTAGLEKLHVTLANFSISGARSSLKVAFDAVVNNARIPVKVDGHMRFNLNRSLLDIEEMAVSLPGIRAVTSGEIAELQTYQRFNALKETVDVDLARAWEGVKPLMDPKTGALVAPSGSVRVSTEMHGTIKRLEVTGSVAFKNVGLRYGELAGLFEGLEGEVDFTEDKVSVTGLRFIVADSPFTFDMKVSNLGLSNPASFELASFAPRGKFSLSSPKVVLDKLMALAGGEDKKGEKDTKGKKAAKPEPPAREPDLRAYIPRRADISGDVRVDEVRYKKIVLGGEVVGVTLSGGKLAFVQKGSLYEGKDDASGSILLTSYPLSFDLKAGMSGFQAKPFMDDAMESFVPKMAGALRGKLSGKAGAKLAVSGKGVTLPNIRKNLKGTGNFLVSNGKVSKIEALQKNVGKYLKSDLFAKDLEFQSLGGDFKIADGKITTPNTTMDPGQEGDFGFLYNGSVSMDADLVLKGALTTRFHPRHEDVVMKGDLGKALFVKDKAGWPSGLWDVTGTAYLPVILPSRKQAGKVLQQKGKEILKQQMPAAKKLLKGLFKK